MSEPTKWIGKQQLAREISKKTGFNQKDIMEIMMALDDVVFEHLAKTTKENPCEVRFMTGVVIRSEIAKGREIVDPRDASKVLDVPERLLPKASITQAYKNRLRERAAEVAANGQE